MAAGCTSSGEGITGITGITALAYRAGTRASALARGAGMGPSGGARTGSPAAPDSFKRAGGMLTGIAVS